MAKPILPDDLWLRIQPFLPPPKARRFRYPGRRPIPDRNALTGILFVLKSGLPWAELPREMGCGSGMSCWRRLRRWYLAGVWDKIHPILLAELNNADQIDWSRAVIDASIVRALGAGEESGPNPTDRGRPGYKHHLLTDANGVPLVADITGANTPDVSELQVLVNSVPPVAGKVGRPRRRPRRLQGDRGYDSAALRYWLRRLRIRPELARRRTKHGSGLGRTRWVVERTIAWLHSFRKLRLVTEKTMMMQYALLDLAIIVICWNILRRSLC